MNLFRQGACLSLMDIKVVFKQLTRSTRWLGVLSSNSEVRRSFLNGRLNDLIFRNHTSLAEDSDLEPFKLHKREWASEKQREVKSGKGSTSLSKSPPDNKQFSLSCSRSAFLTIFLIKRLSATCRSSLEQSAQTVSFIIPLWWWNHIFVLLIETYVTLAKPCTHFTGPHLIEALCLYYSATPPYGHLGNTVTSLYSH